MFGLTGLGGNATLGIGLTVHLNDRFTRNANRIRGQMAGLYGDSTRAINANLTAARNLGIGLTAMGVMGIRGMKNLIGEYQAFEYQLKSVQAIMGKDLQGNWLMDDKTMWKLGDQAKKLGSIYGQLPTHIAEASLQFAKAGLKPDEVMNMTEALLQLGAAADEPIHGQGGVADMMVNIMKTFNMGSDKAQYIADALAKSANLSTVSVRDIFESIRYAGAISRQLQIPFEDILSGLTVMGNAGIRGSLGGVAYMNMYEYLARASSEKYATARQKKALADFGLRPQDLVDESTGKLKSQDELIRMFRAASSFLTPIQRATALVALLGKRGPRAFAPLLQNYEEYQYVTEQMRRVEGTAHETAMKRLDSYEGVAKRFAATWKIFRIDLGHSLMPLGILAMNVLTPILKGLTKLVSTKAGAFLVKMAAGGIVASLALGALLLPLSTIGLLINTAGVGAKAMRTSLVWAWNSIIAKTREAMLWLRMYMKGVRNANIYAGTGRTYGTWGKGGGPTGQRGGTVFVPGGGFGPIAGGAGGPLARFGRSLIWNRGALGSVTRTLLRFGRAFGGLIGAIFVLSDFINGNFGSGIGGLLGGVAGFLMGGPIGAMVGMGLGSMVGSTFDVKSGSMVPNETGQAIGFQPQAYDWQYTGTNNPNDRGQFINIYMDGEQRLSQRINQSQEDYYLGDIYQTGR